MRHHKTTGIRLPEDLQGQVNEKESDGHHNFRGTGKGKGKVNRKEQRKQERASKKQNKAQYFSHSRTALVDQDAAQSSTVKRPAESNEHSDSPVRKRARNGPAPEVLSVKKPAAAPKTAPTKKAPAPIAQLPKSQVEEKEDAYIRYLEKQLGYGGGKAKKKKKSAEDDDGLDDLLDFADDLTYSLSKSSKGMEEYEEEEEEEFDDPYDAILESSDEEEGDATGEGEDEEEWGGIASGSEESEDEEMEDQSPAPAQAQAPETAAPKPVAGTAYVPPHLRKAQGTQSEALLKLTRQLKGLLNRMSEQNLGSILDGMEDIYRDNSRNDVTSTLTNLILEGVASHSILLDSYVVLLAAFIASLHKIQGIEFGAHFVQKLVSDYETHLAALSDASSPEEEDKGKECSNLIVLLSELYNFQVISSVLMFDLVRSLLQTDISEFIVELLLKVLRNSGQQLRTDDPLALKDIVQIVQDKVASNDGPMSSRTRFMIETLTNLKNNKTKKLGEQNQGGAAVDRMKKFLSGLSKTRHILAHEPLRVSLDDLHSADTKGKWWLVGAAWGGNPLVDRQAHMQEIAAAQKAVRDEEGDLVKLARKQGMNSDIRRSIFVVLMSSEDYIDACDRLSQLNLKEIQQREIVRVLLHCAGNEKTYNPYYALVCAHLCQKSHSYKITAQFCLWDFLRDLGETKVGGAEIVKNAKDNDDGFDVKSISKTRLRNVARCYAWLVAKDAVQLGIFKPVDFTVLKSATREFLKEFLTHTLLNSQLSTPLVTNELEKAVATIPRNKVAVEEIFIKGSKTDTVAMGLVYFMNEAFKGVQRKDDGLSKFLAWAVGLAKETLQTGLDVVPVL